MQPVDSVIKESENESFPQHEDTDLFLNDDDDDNNENNNVDEHVPMHHSNRTKNIPTKH